MTPDNPVNRATAPLSNSSASLNESVKDAATTVAQAVKEQAASVASEVGHELGQTADEQISRGADAIRGFARAVDAAGSELEGQSPQLARLIADAAGKIRTVSDEISNREVNGLMAAAGDVARGQPTIFLSAAIATGFALARFLKSSGRDGAPNRSKQSSPNRSSAA